LAADVPERDPPLNGGGFYKVMRQPLDLVQIVEAW